MKRNIMKCLAIGLAVCLLLAGCATSQVTTSSSVQPSVSASSTAAATASAQVSNAAVKGGILKYGLSNEPKSLEPYSDNGWSQKQIIGCVYRTLFDFAEDGSTIPGLCDKYSVSSDGLTWTFHLIDATFHNGDPVTSTDVKFSIEYVRDTPALAAFFTNSYKSMIKEVRVVDDKTVEVVTFKPSAILPANLSSYYGGILSKKWTESHDIKSEPMGCGPFKFVSWERGMNIKVERFDKYAGKVAYLDGIEFDFMADANVRVNALKTGVVDIIDYVPAEQFKSIEATKGMVVDRVEGPFMLMPLNVTVDPLGNAKVRKAMAYAFNRDDILKAAYNGEGTAVYGTPFTKTMVGYNEKYTKYYTYDPNKAKQILAEAGYKDGFTMTLGMSSQYSFNQNTAVSIQSNFKAIGINVTLDNNDWPTFMSKWNAKTFPAAINAQSPPYADPDFLSAMLMTGASGNTGKYTNTKFDELMDKARSEMDKTKRAELYGQVQEIFLEEAPFIVLNWRIQACARKDSVKDFINLPNGMFVQSGTRFNYVWIKK